jgi:hypothetical protein
VLQVTDPLPSDDAFWDWRRNVAEGLAILQTKRDVAVRYVEVTKRRFPDAVDLTKEQLLLETLQLYNGGHYYRWSQECSEDLTRTCENDPDCADQAAGVCLKRWVIRPSTIGRPPRVNPYVDLVLECDVEERRICQ